MLLINSINWLTKDKGNRKLFKKLEIKKLVLKSLLFNTHKDAGIKKKLYYDKKFKNFNTKGSISRCRTSCMFLGNTRSVFRRFKLSRHAAKKYASHGFIPGLRKSSF